MNDVRSVLKHALPADYRLQVTNAIFSMIEDEGCAQHGVVHLDHQSRKYRASTGAKELLCLARTTGSSSELGQALDLSHMAERPEQPDMVVFYNEKGIPVRLRRLPVMGEETIFFVEDMSHILAREMAAVEQGGDIRNVFEKAPYGIYRSTLDGKPIRANPAMARMNGYENEADLMAALKDTGREWYVDPTRRPAFVVELLREGRVIDFVSEVRLHDSDDTMWVSESAWLVKDDSSGMELIEGTVIDASLRVRQEQALRLAAHTDVLSGLANRSAFQACLKEQLNSGIQGNNFAVLLFDLDRFKDINDLFGHARGDQVIVAMAERLKSLVPDDGLVARLGGDEFAMIVKCGGECSEIGAFAQHLIGEIAKPFHIENSDHNIAASIGYAVFPGHGETASELVKAADIALYSAKNTGRGRAKRYNDELAQKKRYQTQLIADLRGADKRGELELFYQSIVDATNNQVVGLEALMRWRHPVRGLVSPVEFIPAAEEAGFMVDFGNWAIDQACMHAKAIPEHLQIAVNVSAVQFYSADLPLVVKAALDRNGIAPSRLELEVTESFILRNEEMTLHLLEELHRLGVRIALDDFGTGYSSLSYLQRFAFDKVKIDKSFVRSLKTSTVNTAIVRAVLSIGRDLGLSVVAEGIETESERLALLHEGCPFFQGFLYSRPRPFDAVAADLQADSLRRLLPFSFEETALQA